MAPQALKAHKVPLAPPVRMALMERKVLSVLPVPLAPMARKARRVKLA